MRKILFTAIAIAMANTALANTPAERYWIKARAKDKFERSRIADTGVSIEMTTEGNVIAIGTEEQKATLRKMGLLETSFVLTENIFDFPSRDSKFHNYDEMRAVLSDLAARHPQIATFSSIGKSVEGRELMHLRISGDLLTADARPGVIFLGGHHAREHLSMEIPMMLAKHLIEGYAAGDAEIRKLVDGRDIHIVPMVNPDGSEHDVSTGSYKMWRKNRAANSNGTYGVDLNRNYDQLWGQGGSSSSPSSETYMGPTPFSEPESRAVRDLVEKQSNVTTLLSFHTFSELVLYPWGGSYDPIPNTRDRAVFETMAKTMAQWNGYTPQQSSDLYIATGDTTDWAYEKHKIFAFTFELDPKSMWDGGFYPGQDVIPAVFNKNLKPCLYLIEHADNPYRVNESPAAAYGLSSPLIN